MSARAPASPLIDVARHVAPDVLASRAGHLMMGFSLTGLAHETLSPEALAERRDRLNLAYRSLADDRLALWVHQVRRRRSPRRRGGHRSDLARELAQARADDLQRRGLWRIDHYVWLVLRADAGAGLEARLRRARRRQVELDAGLVKRLGQLGEEFEALFAEARPRRLTVRPRLGLLVSEPLAALKLALFGADSNVPLVEGPLGAALYDRRLILGRERFELRDAGGAVYGGCLGIKAYASQTRPGQLDGLLDAPFAYTLSQSFAYLTPAAARGVLERKQNQLVSTRDRARSQVEDLDAALDRLISHHFVMGEHQATLTVFAGTPAGLDEALSQAKARLADAGLVAAREDLALEAAWRAQVPGAFAQRPRPAAITSQNLAAFAPLHAPPSGPARPGAWGGPLIALRGRTGVPLEIGLHLDDLGHTFVCGPSGSGKTVLQALLLAELERFGTQRVLIDKDRGAEAFVRASQGRYLALKRGEPTGLAPLKALGDSPGERAWLSDFLALLARGPDGGLDPADRARTDAALDAVLRLPPADRGLEALAPLLGESPVAERVRRFARGGPLGWALDDADDALELEDGLIGFDVTELLDQPEVRAPILSYLFHRIERRLDGRRLALDIDEFWRVLDDPAFTAFARDGLKTWRKKNGALIFATQSPSDALASPIAATILEQCATFFFLPNPQGQARDYVDGFGLTPAEFDWIRRGLRPREVLVRQGPLSAVADFDLGEARDLARLLSSRTADLARLERLIAETGPDYRAWRDPFLDRSSE